MRANKKQKIAGNSGNDFYPCDEKVRGSSSSVEKEQIGDSVQERRPITPKNHRRIANSPVFSKLYRSLILRWH